MGTLYVVSTPIGNLEDISYRGVRILQEVSLIAAEDTRTARVLLQHYDISTPLSSYHDFSSGKKITQLLSKLEHEDLAVISEAGTPGINDPGYALITAALDAEHRVIPIPGPSAPLTALSASGLPTDSFLYLGYLPRKSKARRDQLAEVSDLPHTLIFLESPHRLLDSLDDIHSVLGNRELTVAREMTKIHEEYFQATVSQAREYFSQGSPRGEFTLVIAGAGEQDLKWSAPRVRAALEQARSEGKKSASGIAKQLAQESGWDRREIYDMINAQNDS